MFSEIPDRRLKAPFVVSPLSANHGAHHTLFEAILCGLSPRTSERVEAIHRYKIPAFYAYTIRFYDERCKVCSLLCYRWAFLYPAA
jgi:hypothetical protein